MNRTFWNNGIIPRNFLLLNNRINVCLSFVQLGMLHKSISSGRKRNPLILSDWHFCKNLYNSNFIRFRYNVKSNRKWTKVCNRGLCPLLDFQLHGLLNKSHKQKFKTKFSLWYCQLLLKCQKKEIAPSSFAKTYYLLILQLLYLLRKALVSYFVALCVSLSSD